MRIYLKQIVILTGRRPNEMVFALSLIEHRRVLKTKVRKGKFSGALEMAEGSSTFKISSSSSSSEGLMKIQIQGQAQQKEVQKSRAIM